jgi:hypothetical protein
MTTLRGTWTLTAVSSEAGWTQGVLITGSAAHDGIHPMAVGDVIADVSGHELTVKPHAFDPDVGIWEESLEQEQMSWDPNKGVVITIYADDHPSGTPDHDFNDLVVQCSSQDRDLAAPGHRDMDLTIPEQGVGHRSPGAPWWG